MQKSLTSDCLSTIIIGPTIFQTNLYAKNWILGKYTTDDLVELYNSRSLKYDNISNCPMEFPFFDGSKCITCPPGNPIFNIETSKCGQCEHNEHVDNIHKRCVNSGTKSTLFNNNFEVGRVVAPEGFTGNPSLRTCPPEKPYYNGKECIDCPNKDDVFNVLSKTCGDCPKGQKYNQ